MLQMARGIFCSPHAAATPTSSHKLPYFNETLCLESDLDIVLAGTGDRLSQQMAGDMEVEEYNIYIPGGTYAERYCIDRLKGHEDFKS